MCEGVYVGVGGWVGFWEGECSLWVCGWVGGWVCDWVGGLVYVCMGGWVGAGVRVCVDVGGVSPVSNINKSCV